MNKYVYQRLSAKNLHAFHSSVSRSCTNVGLRCRKETIDKVDLTSNALWGLSLFCSLINSKILKNTWHIEARSTYLLNNSSYESGTHKMDKRFLLQKDFFHTKDFFYKKKSSLGLAYLPPKFCQKMLQSYRFSFLSLIPPILVRMRRCVIYQE